MQAQQNQQDAGPAEPEPEAAGFRLQASGSWLQAPGFRLLVIIKILIFTIFYNTIKRS